jgi:large subunit ribosomal protein L22
VVLRALATAKDHAARYKRMDPSKLIVCESLSNTSYDISLIFVTVAEAWVNKGVQPPKRLEIQGRGHYGFRRSPRSRMTLVLKEGQTLEEKKAAERKRKLSRIISASIVRDDVPLRNPSSTWGW